MRPYDATVLDFYDDRGLLLRELVDDPGLIPDFVKTAEQVDQGAHPELFALVLQEEGRAHKKYSTADAGNTWLSTLYFYETHDRLPEEAQKVAAARLVEACEHYHIEVPDFLYEVIGSIAGEIPDSHIVDVGGKAPPMQKVSHLEKEEVLYAIERSDGSKYYPLTDAKSVKTASEYFSTNHRSMVPRERREFAVKVASLAERGALPVSEAVKDYAGQEYSPHLKGHLATRYLHLTHSEAAPEVREKLVKVASLRQKVEPEDFAQALENFDRESGLDALWDREVPDPWYSTFATEKLAKGALPETQSFEVGVDRVTETELRHLASSGKRTVAAHFDSAIANAFEKDPIGVFKSMPLPQKRVMARMAASFGTVASQ